MRAGKEVTLVGPDGSASRAVITAVVGTGESGAKRLDIRRGDGEIEPNVPHARDSEEGRIHWTSAEDPIDVVFTPDAPKTRKGKRGKKGR